MHIELYTTKSVKECVAALHERLNDGKGRVQFGGYAEKDGRFALHVTSKIALVGRTTQLSGHISKESGQTLIIGKVSEGVDAPRMLLVTVALGFAALLTFLNGAALVGALIAAGAFGLYVLMVGDSQNSALLLKELKRILAAKDKPIPATSPLAKSAVAAKPAAKPLSSSAKPAPKAPASAATAKKSPPTAKNSSAAAAKTAAKPASKPNPPPKR